MQIKHKETKKNTTYITPEQIHIIYDFHDIFVDTFDV